MRQGCGKDTARMRQGCGKDAARMRQGCGKDAANSTLRARVGTAPLRTQCERIGALPPHCPPTLHPPCRRILPNRIATLQIHPTMRFDNIRHPHCKDAARMRQGCGKLHPAGACRHCPVAHALRAHRGAAATLPTRPATPSASCGQSPHHAEGRAVALTISSPFYKNAMIW